MSDYSVSAVRGAEANLPTKWGEFSIVAYRDIRSGKEHAAIVKGDVKGKTVLVRVHSECLTGDLFGSLRCDCGQQLQEALQKIEAEGAGMVLYLRQEGRGIGLIEKISAYALQEGGLDTVEANRQLGHPDDARTYEAAKDILDDLGVTGVRLLTNNPTKVDALEALGIHVVERIAHEVPSHPLNKEYMRTKQERMGHVLKGL